MYSIYSVKCGRQMKDIRSLFVRICVMLWDDDDDDD